MLTDFHDRKAALDRAKVSQSEIGRRTGFSQPYVHEVMKRTRSNPQIEQAIAEAIGRPVLEVFPPTPEAVAA